MSTITIGQGKAAMSVSPISLGCMTLTGVYNEPTPEDDALTLLKTAYDLGVRHFDTAQLYQLKLPAPAVPGVDGVTLYNEELLGKFLKTLTKEQRNEVTVATKFWPGEGDWCEEAFVEATKKSAERLGVECIDLYYFHRIYPETVVPVEQWMGAAKRLVEQGLIKRIGLSEASAAVIRKANEIYPITCIQQEWSLFARDLEKEIVPTCKELGIGIIAYSPVGRGILAGGFNKGSDTPKDWRSSVPYLSKKNIAHNLTIIDEIKALGAKKGHTASQMCLAWLMKQGAVPIPGTTKIDHLKDNMGALNVVLTDEEFKKLGDLGNQVIGERGSEDYMKKTFHNV